MIDLNKRSSIPELLDHDKIPFADIQQNMKELNTINRLLGGHAITIAGVQKILEKHPADSSIHICEIGCGGGDNLVAIHRWLEKTNIVATFTGIDIKPECIAFAQTHSNHLQAKWISSDYATVDFADHLPDIIFSSLFCHHFSEAELVKQLLWMRCNSGKGFFINDLHRHFLAYQSIKLLTRLFSRSYLVKNDAPLSVARGFVKREWQQLFQKAAISNYNLQWKWAFRHLITYQHEGS